MSAVETSDITSFDSLGLNSQLVETLGAIGYEKPSPIQQKTIPTLLAGNDVIGLAQTGTGKTAAFALPVLSKIDPKVMQTQALVLCPTRELANQVAQAFEVYAGKMKKFRILAIYGGQDMRTQLRELKQGVHIVVGTPGRLLDHLQRKSLNLNCLKTLVLDEADEMLRMGFIDDVEEVLKLSPPKRQIALFSATMPKPVRKVADNYLNNPQEIHIQSAAKTNENIAQQYWMVQGASKIEAISRILEVEDYEGVMVFVRTKNATIEVADKLVAKGFSAAALNGDMNQQIRQRTVDQLKGGQLDILVATDVAARGLDVDRISHVLNYDIPYDNEAYVHRIGRTGRAGRKGKAILFVNYREKRLLHGIERSTRQRITPMDLPTPDILAAKRSRMFKDRLIAIMSAGSKEHQNLELSARCDKKSHKHPADLSFFNNLVNELCEEQSCSSLEVAAAMAYLLQKDRPLQLPPEVQLRHRKTTGYSQQDKRRKRFDEREPRGGPNSKKLTNMPPMERFRIAVGRKDNVTPQKIVAIIASEAGIEGRHIGYIGIHDAFSTVDLPANMPKEVFINLKQAKICRRSLHIEKVKLSSNEFSEDSSPRLRYNNKKNRRNNRDNDQKYQSTTP